ncbi:hypothetical protein J1G34_16255 [Pseudomonas sp. Wu6]|uniref:hypothetical protein n=1 Tax=Pseudomonas sp. Wu6 TaxID=1210129 RepID=UPI001CA61EF0|nr:hypothetical protein [Pseudomonas sp. Wu6]MBY8930594.1 hypothetical protein [Pseudomonas sp. Wu6]
MTIGIITSLQIVEVMDHGVPNLERIAIYVTESCDLSEYCLLIGLPALDGTTTPIKDHMLWFGHGFANVGDWVMIYTASGSTTIIPNGLPSAGTSIQPRVINIHWGKNHTVFQNRAIIPMLIKIQSLAVPTPPAPAYQGNPEAQRNRIL